MTKRRAEEMKNTILAEIIGGRLAPGARLDELSLADRFGISRTPVREALFELAATGVIELRRNRGAVVAAIAPRRLADMFEVLAALIGRAAHLAAGRMTDSERNALEEAMIAFERAADGGDAAARVAAEGNLRAILLAGCGNGFLAEEVAHLALRLQPYQRRRLERDHVSSPALANWAGLVEAVVTGEPANLADFCNALFALSEAELAAFEQERYAEAVMD